MQDVYHVHYQKRLCTDNNLEWFLGSRKNEN